MDASKTVQNLIPVFMEDDMIGFQKNISATESAIKQNHQEILDWLEHTGKIDAAVLNDLKKELKIG